MNHRSEMSLMLKINFDSGYKVCVQNKSLVRNKYLVQNKVVFFTFGPSLKAASGACGHFV